MDVKGYFISIILDINLFIYEGIKNLYNLLLYIAEHQIVSNETISSFSSRIYVLLGIFMLFKLSFSLVTYVVNPDEFFDKTKGISSIGKNIIIALVLIVLTPYLFEESRELQTNMLNEHVIENLVFGDSARSYATMNDGGRTIQYQLFAQWIRPNTEINSLSECTNLYAKQGNGTDARSETVDDDGYYLYELNSECMDAVKAEFSNANDLGAYNDYEKGLQTHNISRFYNDRIFKTANVDGKYIIKYNSLFSIICGIIVIFILISFCFDIAVRSIKLAFFQIMAPIPIISLCDPKGKDGMFKKWGSAVIKTYLSLFIRLGALYFAISIISQVLVDPKWHPLESTTEGFATAFIVIGALMFAKQLPGILSEITGIKLDSKLTLNPFKKIEDEALGGKRITSGMGAVGAMGVAFAANTAAGVANEKGLRKFLAPFSGLRGAADAAAKGVGGAWRGDGLGKTFSSSYKNAMDARKRRGDMKDEGVGALETFVGNIQHGLGMYTAGDKVEAAKKKNENIQAAYKSMMSAAQGNDKGLFTVDGGNYYDTSKSGPDLDLYNRLVSYGLNNHQFEGIKDLQKYIDEVSKTQIDRNAYTGPTADADYAKAVREHEQMVKDLEDVRDRRLNKLADGTETQLKQVNGKNVDEGTLNAITEGYKKMQQLAHEINGINKEFGIKTIEEDPTKTDAKRINGESKGVGYEYGTSGRAEHATRVNQYIKTEKK